MPAAVALIGIATLISAGGAIYSGVQQNKAAKYTAAVAEQGALAAEDKAAYDEEQHRERVRKLISTQRALYGKSGVDLTGSPLLTLQETAGQGELDALAIRHGGSVESAKQRSSGTLARMQGKSARTASYIQAGSTLLSGASSAYTAATAPKKIT